MGYKNSLQTMLSLLLFSASTAAINPNIIPSIPIAPGVYMPLAGFGTWQYNSSKAETTVKMAMDLGCRHIDTALDYENQDGVGRALKASGVARSDYFLVSKIPGGETTAQATADLNTALEQLFPGEPTAYIDLMLIHFPATWGGLGGKVLRQAEWKALEAFAKAGKAKSIGVSHYCRKHLDDILEIATITPAVNQVQYHVGMGTAGPNGTDDKDYMKAKGVTYQSFSPLCGPCDPPDNMELITGPLVTSIGARYNKTGAQVALKWLVQQGIPVIPKSDNPTHIAQNLDLFGWTLNDQDMAELTEAKTPAVAGDGKGNSGDCDVS